VGQASDHGNSDAVDRLAALNQPSPQALSRQEHDSITEAKLIRKRTQAKQRSEVATSGYAPRQQSGLDGRQVIEIVRKNSTNLAPEPVQNAVAPGFDPIPERTESPSAVPTANPGSEYVGSPRPRPTPPGGRAFPNTNRYTLTDAPVVPFVGVGVRPQSVGGVRPAGRPPASRLPSGGIQPAAPPVPRPAKTGPTTFAEMGITAGKAPDKECVIM
jgi:hypothetical protein